MDYNVSRPSVYLSQYVKQYWSMENCVPEGKEHIQRIIPNGLFELIFYADNRPKASDPKKSIGDNIIITGQLKKHYDLKISGKLSLFAVYFLPHGLSMFLNLPIKELFNHSVPLKLIILDKINQLEDELSSAISFDQKIIASEKFLTSQIRENEKKIPL